MALQSAILAGSPRLEQAAAGGPSVKKRPPDDDPDAVRRIQRALVQLGFALPKSFPNGPAGEPDGLFGPETFNAVYGFQKREFPNQYGQWDGRVGPNTLAKMDAQLPRAAPDEERMVRQSMRVATVSRCETKADQPGTTRPGFTRPGFMPPGSRRV